MSVERNDLEQQSASFTEQLRGFVRRRLTDDHIVDDIVQDVMCRLVRHRSSIDEDRVGAWLFTVARHAIVDAYRARACPEDPNATVPPAPETSQERAELLACMAPLFETLDADDRAILREVDLEGIALTTIAARDGLPISTVKSRIQRARQRFGAVLRRCCDVELDGYGQPIAIKKRRSSCDCC